MGVDVQYTVKESFCGYQPFRTGTYPRKNRLFDIVIDHCFVAFEWDAVNELEPQSETFLVFFHSSQLREIRNLSRGSGQRYVLKVLSSSMDVTVVTSGDDERGRSRSLVMYMAMANGSTP